MADVLHTITFIAFLTLVCLSQAVHGYTTIEQLDELLNEKKQNYNTLLRPKLNQSEPLVIQMAFELIAIRDLDEIAERFSAVGTVYMIWKDEQMVWDPKKYGGLYTFIVSSGDFWTPPFILVNTFEKFEKVGEDSYWPIRFYASGDTVYHPGQVFTTTCSVDVTLYPWDIQTCELLFTVWGYAQEEIMLWPYANTSTVGLTYFSGNGEWDVERTLAGREGNNFFRFSFTLKRKPLFIVVNTLIPIIFMSLLNLMAFLIPIDSGERISYCITVLLAVAVFLTIIGDNVPRSATSIAVLCYYLACVLALSMFIIFASIISMRVHSTSESRRISTPWRIFVRVVRCRWRCRKTRNVYEKKTECNKKAAYLQTNDYMTYRGNGNVKPLDGIRPNAKTINIISDMSLENDPEHYFTPSKESMSSFKTNRSNGLFGAAEQENEIVENDDIGAITWIDVSSTLNIVFGGFSFFCLIAFTVYFFVHTTSKSL